MEQHNTIKDLEPARHSLPSSWKIWLVFFALAASFATSAQFLVLPYLFPAAHGGDGLLAGSDSIHFHKLAYRMSQAIRTDGWSAWRPKPENQGPAGIAAAIYAFSVPRPWTLIPFNAALHATATMVLLMILQRIVGSRRIAFFSVLPFLLYPSALLWYSQLHKDGYSICGFLLFTYGFMLLVHVSSSKHDWGQFVRGVLFCCTGVILIWLVRPYMLSLLQALSATFLLGILIFCLVFPKLKELHWLNVLLVVLAMGVLLMAMDTLSGEKISSEVFIPQTNEVLARNKPDQGPFALSPEWKASPLLPAMLDSRLHAIAHNRNRHFFLYPAAKSTLDYGLNFHSAKDIVFYLPRAAEIAFFAPFPSQLFAAGGEQVGIIMRRAALLEMLGVYIALCFLPYAVWTWRGRVELWIVLTFCVSMMVLYSLTVPNAGSLYRARYGFLMTLVAVGVAGAFRLRKTLQGRRRDDGLKINA
jgi:hypothetical protein